MVTWTHEILVADTIWVKKDEANAEIKRLQDKLFSIGCSSISGMTFTELITWAEAVQQISRKNSV